MDNFKAHLSTEKEKDFERSKLSIEILITEYQHRCDEMRFYMEQYHKHTNVMQLYLTIMGSLMFFLIKEGNLISSLGDSVIIGSFLIILATVIAFYFVSNMLEELYYIYINGCRISKIEKIINSKVSEKLLVWDSEIICKIQNLNYKPSGAWIRPNLFASVFNAMLFFSILIGLGIVAHKIVNPFFYYYVPIVTFLVLVTVWQWYLLHTDGIGFINSVIEKKSFFHGDNQSLIIIFLVNFCFGYLPMALFSIRDKAFWGGGEYQFYFLSNFSVVLGDLIILPIIANSIFKYFKHFEKKINLWCSVFFLIISFVVNIIIHKSWIADDYLGFMDINKYELSSAGLIHFFYSVVYLFLIVTFFFHFLGNFRFRKLCSQRLILFSWIKRNCYLFCIFLVLGLIDEIYKVVFFNFKLNDIVQLFALKIILIGLICVYVFSLKRKLRKSIFK